MRNHTIALVAALVAARSVSAQFFEARTMGMGGASTAAANSLAASWANPALLARARENDSVSLLLPTIGALAYDKTGLLQDLEDFVDEFERLDGNGSATPQDYVDLAARLQSLSGRDVNANVGAGFALAVPSQDLAWSLHFKTWADLRAVVQVDPADLVAIATTAPGNPLPAVASEARVVGAAISEVGVSLATRFDLGGLGLAVGATPKYQRVDTYNYSVNVSTYDANDFSDDQYRNDDGAFNFDLGAAFEPGLGFTIGAMGRDLIARDYQTVTTFGEVFTYEVQPQFTLGAAWQIGLLTLAADVELLARERFADQTLSLTSLRLSDDVQTARLGAELDLAAWVQLRFGVETDFENTLDDAFSAGLGLSPFDTVHLDVAGTYIDTESYGLAVQFGVTF